MFIDKKILFNYFEKGKIYKFKNSKFNNTDGNIPHYHIVLGIDHQKEVAFVALTSQRENTIKRLQNMKKTDNRLIVHIPKNSLNKLTEQFSYIDCVNAVHVFTFDELIELYNSKDKIKEIGQVDDYFFEQIKIGINIANTQKIKDLKRFNLYDPKIK